MTSDVALEEGRQERLRGSDLPSGYPSLGHMMGLNPDKALFRRFASMNAQILLHKQCELMRLEKRYREAEAHNSTSSDATKRKLVQNAGYFTFTPLANDPQIKLLEEMTPKLKEYCESLNLQHTLANMPEPSKLDVAHIQNFMASTDEGRKLLPLRGVDQHVWGALHDHHGRPVREAGDLVTLHKRREVDPFSRWVTGSGLQRWFACGLDCGRKPSPKSETVSYSEKALLRLTSWVTTIVASVLPVMSILVLARVQSMQMRLAMVAMFNVLVSICLLVFSDAKRSEIFATAAAFAAVQVVFVGTASINHEST